jgi:hypothetical protein
MGYMEATESLKHPFLITRYTSPSSMCGDRNLLSLNASPAIPKRVLRFEDSGLRRRTPVRPVLLTCQTSTHRSNQSSTAAAPSSVLALWINQGTSGFLVNHQKPRELGVACANLHS